MSAGPELPAVGPASPNRARGEKNGNFSLTDQQIAAILQMKAMGKSNAKIAERFETDASTVWRIVTGKSRADVRPDLPRVPSQAGKRRGQAHGRAVVPDAAIPEILAAAKRGVTYAKLARDHGTCASNIGCIVRRETRREAGDLDRPVKRRDKLSDDQVEAIRLRLAAGARGVDLAREYDVSPATICEYKTGRKRPHAGGQAVPALPFPYHGEANPNAKLTDSQAADLRLPSAAEVSNTELAGPLGVDRRTVSRARKAETFQHVEVDATVPPVRLAGPRDPVSVFVVGKGWVSKGRLPAARYDVVKALADAYPVGLLGDILGSISGRGGWWHVLQMMLETDPDWAAVIHFPDASRGDTYRFIWPTNA